MRRLCLGDSRSPPDKVYGRASSRSPHVPTAWKFRSFEMKFAWITAALVCFSMNSADAGLFSKKSNCGCAPTPSCCAPAPTCAAPAPSCAAPAPVTCAPAPAPVTCAPAPVTCAPAAPSCAAPVACAPSCSAPAVHSCCAPAPSCDPCAKKCKTKRFSLRDWAGKFKKSKKSCCAVSHCGYSAPTCAAPVAPSCAVPAASCCH